MKSNDAGFLFPTIEESQCINCDVCQRVCPLLNSIEIKPIASYGAQALDEEIRKESSSGGVFSELALLVLSENGFVAGAAYDDFFSVEHIIINSEQELYKLRGAKYSQSALGDIFQTVKQVLLGGKLVLFSGTPCQIAGLKGFLGKDYDNLLCIDFVCHGVPSPMVWQKYVRYRSDMDNQGNMPININLRSKITGWSRYKYSNIYEYMNGKTYQSQSGNDLFMRLFTGNYILRDSCEKCDFKGVHRASDITVGDFWGIWNLDPEFDDNKGTSLIITNTPKGEVYVHKIKQKLRMKEFDIHDSTKENPSYINRSKSSKYKNTVLENVQKGNWAKIESVLDYQNQSFLRKVYLAIRQVLSQ